MVEFLDSVEIDRLGPLLCLAVAVDKAVFHNPEQPRLAVGPLFKPIEEPVGFQAGLLGQIIRLIPITGQSQCIAVQRFEMRKDFQIVCLLLRTRGGRSIVRC